MKEYRYYLFAWSGIQCLADEISKIRDQQAEISAKLDRILALLSPGRAASYIGPNGEYRAYDADGHLRVKMGKW